MGNWVEGVARRRPAGRATAQMAAALIWSLALAWTALSSRLAAEEVVVNSIESLNVALRNPRPGTVFKLAPGTYNKRIWASGPIGTEAQPITITAQDPARPPVIAGCDEGLHLSGPQWVVVSHLTIEKMIDNGVNIDDGGDFNGGANHVILKNLRVRNIGPSGNSDGIKLSGLVDFVVQDCVVEDWGAGGQAIDMVGCRRGVIADCVLTQHHDGGEGVQLKGGTAQLVVKNCTIDLRAGGRRGVNVGGSTGLQFFRPKVDGYESKQVAVLGNRIVGAPETPIAFVTNQDSAVVYNTLVDPQHFLIRILQENSNKGLLPCAGGLFASNLVVFQRAKVKIEVNVGSKTKPDSFKFAGNFWYASDQPGGSQVNSLPTAETGGTVGIDPQLDRTAGKNWAVAAGSPAAQVGAHAPGAHKAWQETYSLWAPWAAGVVDAALKNRPATAAGGPGKPTGGAATVPPPPPINPERAPTLLKLKAAAREALAGLLVKGRSLEVTLPYQEQYLAVTAVGADPEKGLQAKVLGAVRYIDWGTLRPSHVAGVLEGLIGEDDAGAAEHWYLCAALYAADGNAMASSEAATKALDLEPALGEKLKDTMGKLR